MHEVHDTRGRRSGDQARPRCQRLSAAPQRDLWRASDDVISKFWIRASGTSSVTSCHANCHTRSDGSSVHHQREFKHCGRTYKFTYAFTYFRTCILTLLNSPEGSHSITSSRRSFMNTRWTFPLRCSGWKYSAETL